MDEYNTKYPIVLVHGMILKDFKLFKAFRKIKDNLLKENIKVYVTNQDGIGSIENNAMQLKDEILKILEKENVDKVNIIAHSKGGLDSRYMISKLDMDKHVASLTTLSTPHHGSKLSSKLLSMPKWCAKFLAFFINLFYKICKDKKPDILTLGHQLKDDTMIDFNKEVLNSSKVYYQSYSSDLNNKKSFLMFIPHLITKNLENVSTDGIVSVESSVWGEYKGNIKNNYDHAQMVGVYGTNKTLNEVSKFYLDVIENLSQIGF